ncbi:MAG: transcription-repair coupling factor [Cytophagales bacterium]|nr:MAG: transcription-repair coupling factor [Cytophagales bacterium]TAF62260.1 MAG: transcription-repair coupling factor [Cytophagales bacterium]
MSEISVKEPITNPQEWLSMYLQSSFLQNISQTLTQEPDTRLQLKGLEGALDAVLVASLYTMQPQTMLLLLSDREEAQHFYNDLRNLLDEEKHNQILFFPMSYKTAYKFEQVENANVLQRAETLSQLQYASDEPKIIVSYAEALTDRVISKRSLVSRSFNLTVNQQLEMTFLEEMLRELGFEKADFVNEAGQYAIRGGIVDVFSYSNDHPYRVEFVGNDIESIRFFNPDSQLSLGKLQRLSIIPNIHEKATQEKRESFFEFLPPQTCVWLKDYHHTLRVVEKTFEKAQETFQNGCEHSPLLLPPEELFEQKETVRERLEQFKQVEFGKFMRKPSAMFTPTCLEWKCQKQPSFHKDFKLLAQSLDEYKNNGYQCFVCSDYPKQLDRLQMIFAELSAHTSFLRLGHSLREGFIDHENHHLCYTDHEIFEKAHRYRSNEKFSKSKSLTLKELNNLQVGDYVTHIDHGVARFAGLQKVMIADKEQEAIRLIYRDNDTVLVSLHSLHKLSKYSSQEGAMPTLSKLGSQEWAHKKSSAKKAIKAIGFELIKLYAKRRFAPGFQYSKDTYLQAALESSFIYEDTPDQATATQDVKQDMEKPYPMDRLICGDVGFGKTEVAVRAAFKAVTESKQVIVLVPTTILAAQHYRTFSERFKNMPCRVDYVNRFRTAKEVKNIQEKLSEGQIDILIGTSKVVGKDFLFKDLGLIIIDEEQKFGVKVKDKLKEIKYNVDCLTMTATPIPRTLQFSLMGARDLSVMHTPPSNRHPVHTEVHTFDYELIRDAISQELKRGGQVFFVHNRVYDIEAMADLILQLVPDAKVAVAHGQMKESRLEDTMLAFLDNKLDVLVSTNIIEAGLDIPNANTIIINHSHNFGLSDLHQMRGRVGRSNIKAFCYLLVPSMLTLPPDARKRLKALEEFSELGDGFKIAMRDLDIRGAGNLLGAEQSGFVADLGFEAYHKILDEALEELREEEFKDMLMPQQASMLQHKMKAECVIETDLQILMPESYIPNISERLALYIQVDKLKNETELENFRTELLDRFGKMPPEVEDLLKTVQLRWLANSFGFEKLTLKNGVLKAQCLKTEKYFQSAIFGAILQYVTQKPQRAQLKEAQKSLFFTVERVSSVEGALTLLNNIQQQTENA